MRRTQPKKEVSVTAPLLKDLVARQKDDFKRVVADTTIGSDPLPPPDLYQDAGSGYNPDFTFPQE